jgi:TRAP-type transport system small permease protein
MTARQRVSSWPPVQAAWARYLDVLRVACATMLIAVVVITLANVARRYLGYGTFPWADETARRLLLWMTFVGAALAVAHAAHLRIDTLVQVLPERGLRILGLAVGVLSVAFFAVLIVGGLQHTISTAPRRTSAMGVSAAWNSAVMPVGGALMLLSFLGRILLAPAHRVEPPGPDDEPAVGPPPVGP